MTPAVFLDRDGTLIEDVGYISDPVDVRVLPGVREALARLRAAGFALVIVTNQSGIGRGYFAEEDYEAVRRATEEALDIDLDGVYHCPHAPDAECSCRKPAPGMLLRAARELDLDLDRSWMIGDHESDARAGLNAGCRSILLGRAAPDEAYRCAGDLPAAADIVLATEGEAEG